MPRVHCLSRNPMPAASRSNPFHDGPQTRRGGGRGGGGGRGTGRGWPDLTHRDPDRPCSRVCGAGRAALTPDPCHESGLIHRGSAVARAPSRRAEKSKVRRTIGPGAQWSNTARNVADIRNMTDFRTRISAPHSHAKRSGFPKTSYFCVKLL